MRKQDGNAVGAFPVRKKTRRMNRYLAARWVPVSNVMSDQ